MPTQTRISPALLTSTVVGKVKQSQLSKLPSKNLTTTQKSKYETKSTIGKRKRNDDHVAATHSTPDLSSTKTRKEQEKRSKPFRKHAPKSFLEKLQRAQTQRMIVVGRRRKALGAELCEEVDIVGSTGNIYEVTISKLPECTCPDHRKGNECKHKVYVLHTVLKAPEHLQYQRAFLTTELEEIFANAPPIPTDIVAEGDHRGKRKPIEGECPICYMDLEEDADALVWCKAACGNNMHKSCFEQWAASQPGQAVRCVYCRTEWELDKDDLAKIKKSGVIGEDGYVNVAEQFGMSRARDYTSYFQPWARRQFGYGW